MKKWEIFHRSSDTRAKFATVLTIPQSCSVLFCSMGAFAYSHSYTAVLGYKQFSDWPFEVLYSLWIYIRCIDVPNLPWMRC